MSSLTSLLKNLKAGQLHPFHGGVHPPQRKAPANLSNISQAGLPEELILQVRQHIGQLGQLSVNVGERVLKGQALTEALNPMMVPVHAPTSGLISAIEDRPLCHPSGLSGLCIILKPDGLDEWRARFPVADYHLLEPQVLISRILQAGIAGLGGAAFPTNVKLAASQATEQSKVNIDTLIINGVECEPYISADDRLMREHAGEILQGIDILRHIVKPKVIILAVEDNKPEALAALKAAHVSMQATRLPVQAARLPVQKDRQEAATKSAITEDDSLHIVAIPTKYPSGGQKQLIEVLTGLQVPHQGRSADLGILMHNVGTVFAIQQAIIEDAPLTQRVVTLAGEAFEQPGNAWVHLGTPVRYLLKRYGLKAEREQRIIIGGPMMGFTLHSAAAPIIKGSNCVLAPKAAELSPPTEEMACIRCSKCADACPASLLPQQLYWYARSEEHDKLESHNLFDCIECGACAYVCPSSIPLVQYYRVAKADIRHAQLEVQQAERAKERFEARQARLALEKEERQARQAKAAAERKARMAEQAAKTGEDPVAAALARVKARQLEDTPPLTADEMSAARAARKEEARRNRALKAAQVDTAPDASGAENQAQADSGSAHSDTAHSDTALSDTSSQAAGKNPAVVAALARAKARQAAASEAEPTSDTSSKPKNPAVAAAIAKAKAAQAAANKRDSGNERVDHKKEAIKAAVARAKARQEAERQAAMAAVNATDQPPSPTVPANEPAAKHKTQSDTETGNEHLHPADAKQAAIQAAVARAKARKLAQAAETESNTQAPSSTPEANSTAESVAGSETESVSSEQAATLSPADTKKAAIQAAVAHAKARKLAQAAETETNTQAPSSMPEANPTHDPTAGSETESVSTEQAATLSPADAKKAAIQAAVARAKARKLAQAEPDKATAKPAVSSEQAGASTAQLKPAANEPATAPQISAEPELDPAAAKQAAIKAAVARAKARKALAEAAKSSPSSASLLDKEEQS